MIKFYLKILIVSLIVLSCGERHQQVIEKNYNWSAYQGGPDRNQYSPLTQSPWLNDFAI